MTREERSAAMVKARHMRRIASLGPDAGLWSWKSSPHVLWLASVLQGVRYA